MVEVKKKMTKTTVNKKSVAAKTRPTKSKKFVSAADRSASAGGKFAVIETGGKQYLVAPGSRIKIERIEKPQKGSVVYFDKVLLLAKGDKVQIGAPYLAKAKIKAQWLGEKKAKKITNVRYKSKTRRSRKKGHRQIYTEVIISDF